MQSSCVKAPFASHFIADCEYPISDIHHTLYRDASSGRGHRIGSSGRFRYFYYERCFFIYDPYQHDHGSRHSQGPCISDDAAYSDEYGDRGFLGRVGFFFMQLLSIIVILGFYYLAFTPFVVEEPLGTFIMFVLAWFSVC